MPTLILFLHYKKELVFHLNHMSVLDCYITFRLFANMIVKFIDFKECICPHVYIDIK